MDYCQRCHLFPEPDLLDRRTWTEKVLPRMRFFLGLVKPDYAHHPEGAFVKASGAVPETPIMSEEEWGAVVEYYLNAAPDKPLPQSPRPQIQVGLPHFKTEIAAFRPSNPATTMVAISPRRQKIFLGDDQQKALFVLNSKGAPEQVIHLNNVPVDLVERDEGLYVTCIGSFPPSERPDGMLLRLAGLETGKPLVDVLLTQLPRPVQVAFADLNGDGKTDFFLCGFGNLCGRFSWYENLGNGNYKEHRLTNKAGAVRCVVHDFNGDGKPDVAVLMTQEMEMMIVLLNDGKGNFCGDQVFQKPPVYGHSYFELADFNHDGLMDLLVTNGDNGEYGDYESPMKKYHGIRIYLNRGQGHFEEAFFFPMNGCYRAIARDFRGNGQLDIAAISFFPDYKRSPEESFVYLENQGGLKFKPYTFPECNLGRWLTMDVGDLDGDGDLDIVLGSYIHGPMAVPERFVQAWETNGVAAVILRNTLR